MTIAIPYYVRLVPKPPKHAAPRIRRVTAPSPLLAMASARQISRAYEPVAVSIDGVHFFIPTQES